MATIRGTTKGKKYAPQSSGRPNVVISRDKSGSLRAGSISRGSKVITNAARIYPQSVLNKAALSRPGTIIPEAYKPQGQFAPQKPKETIIQTPSGAMFIEGRKTAQGAVIPFNERTSGVYSNGQRVGETLKRPEVLYGLTDREVKKRDDYNNYVRLQNKLYKEKVKEQTLKKIKDDLVLSRLKTDNNNILTYKPKELLNPIKSDIGVKQQEKQKEFLEKIRTYTETQAEIQKTKQLRRGQNQNVVENIATSAFFGGARGVIGVASMIRHPVQTVQGTWQVVKNPLPFAQSETKRFSEDPLGVIAEYYTFGKTQKIIGYSAQNNPLSKYVREEVYIRRQPKAIQPYVRAIIKSADVQKKLNPFKLKEIKKVKFSEVKQLNKVEAKALQIALAKTDSVIFGSTAARTLSKGKTKLPKDVDLATTNVQKFNKEFIKALPDKLQKKYSIKKEAIKRADGTKILDVKPLERLIQQRGLLTGKGILPVSGFKNKFSLTKNGLKIKKVAVSDAYSVSTQKLQNVGGIKIVGFGEQTLRKGLGTIQVLVERNARRAKDPAGFVESLEIQIEGLRYNKPFNWKMKARKLSDAVNILTSKGFKQALNKKVPGLLKEFPILRKFNKNYVQPRTNYVRAIGNTIKNKLNIRNIRQKAIFRRYISSKPAKVLAQVESYLPQIKRLKYIKTLSSYIPRAKMNKVFSYLPASKLAKYRSVLSKMPGSRIPRSKIPLSRLPSRLIRSKIPQSKLVRSKVPGSKIPRSKLGISRVPGSRVPISRIPGSRVPSSRVPQSRLPGSRIPGSKIPSSRLIPIRGNGLPVLLKRFFIPVDDSDKRNSGRSFNVYAKTGGMKTKYIRINAGGLHLRDAFNYGKYVIDKSKLASFKILPSSARPTMKFNLQIPNHKFTFSKRNPNIIIEKRRYRMDIRTEQRQISINRLRRLRTQRSVVGFFRKLFK